MLGRRPGWVESIWFRSFDDEQLPRIVPALQELPQTTAREFLQHRDTSLNASGGPDSKEGEAYGLVLGQVIAQLRKQHGNMTQAELAHRLGISQSMLSKIESGKQPDAYHFSQIAQVFGLDVQQLNARVLDAMQRAQQAAAAVNRQPKASSGWGELLALAGFVGLVMFAVAAVVGDDAKPTPEPARGPKPQ